jgi:hypothetical protein
MGNPQSGFGIASFVVSILGCLSIFFSIVLAVILGSANPEGVKDNSIEAIVLGLAMLGSMAMLIIALVLGVVGIMSRNRSKVFAILGSTFSGLALAGALGLIILGLLME